MLCDLAFAVADVEDREHKSEAVFNCFADDRKVIRIGRNYLTDDIAVFEVQLSFVIARYGLHFVVLGKATHVEVDDPAVAGRANDVAHQFYILIEIDFYLFALLTVRDQGKYEE